MAKKLNKRLNQLKPGATYKTKGVKENPDRKVVKRKYETPKGKHIVVKPTKGAYNVRFLDNKHNHDLNNKNQTRENIQDGTNWMGKYTKKANIVRRSIHNANINNLREKTTKGKNRSEATLRFTKDEENAKYVMTRNGKVFSSPDGAKPEGKGEKALSKGFKTTAEYKKSKKGKK